jgi:phosphoribosylaminoimidazolecarboxamide formyltransferase/IMP cyclohydrolase
MAAPVARALLSVSDKTGLVEFARALHARGVALLSTGGTARAIADAGLPVTDVGAYTGFPEMLDGRVKTLHPKVHGGILARRDLAAHADALASHGIPTIDLVVVNLYPFRETVAKRDCTLDDAIENIDIGGPAMVRAAAKNWAHVGIVVDPSDYAPLSAELARTGALSDATRFALARKAFAHTAAYDGAIANWLTARAPDGSSEPFPQSFRYAGERVQSLRYGENPHQAAAFYRDEAPAPGTIATYRQRQGKELSYNNIADADAAWECVKALDATACVIVKHANPCGVALGATTLEAYRRAFATDPTSAFGGIIAFNRPVDAATLEAVALQFVEVLIAPAYTDDAIGAIASKKNVRVLEVPLPAGSQGAAQLDFKRVGGGLLVQTADAKQVAPAELKVVTRRQPTPREVDDLLFAWRVAKYVTSNAI